MRYLFTFTAPALAVAAFLGHGWWTWAPVLYAFGLVPLLELIIPERHQNLSDEEEQAALSDPLFDILLYLIVPVQWGLLVLFLLTVDEAGLARWEVAGRVTSMGILCGIYGINVAHELGHRVKRWERDLARALLLTSLYMHFIIEHNRGHHRRVATPDDPAPTRSPTPARRRPRAARGRSRGGCACWGRRGSRPARRRGAASRLW